MDSTVPLGLRPNTEAMELLNGPEGSNTRP